MRLKQFTELVPIANTTAIMNAVVLAAVVAAIGLTVIVVIVGVRMLLDLADDWSSLYKQD